MAAGREQDLCFRLATSEMQVIEVGRDRLAESRQFGVDQEVMVAGVAARALSGRPALPLPPVKPALVSLVAGRPKGKQLFTGSLLTLRYFLSPLNATISETRLFRGLERAKDLVERPAVRAGLHAWGPDWGCRLLAGKVPGYTPLSHPGTGCGNNKPLPAE